MKDEITTTFRENVRYELLKFLSFLSSMDMEVTSKEVDFIIEATGFKATQGMINSVIASEHLRESRYLDNVPFSFKYFSPILFPAAFPLNILSLQMPRASLRTEVRYQ